METTTQTQIEKRVAFIRKKLEPLLFREISQMSGLPISTLAGIQRPGWNPKLSTLIALERAIMKKPAA